MCFNGTRNDRCRAIKIHQAKYFPGKESAQKRPNVVEFASCSNRCTQLQRVESTNGEFSTTGGADALGKWIASGGMSLGERFDEGPFKEDADEMTFIFGAAFEVIDRVCGLGQSFRGVSQLFFYRGPGAGE